VACVPLRDGPEPGPHWAPRRQEDAMALNERLKRFLHNEQVAYQVLPHREAFTAHEVAVESHAPERRVAKVVVLQEHGGDRLLVVLPAACRLDLTALKHATRRHKLSLVHEEEMGRLFPDCETGAMPPYGNLYGLPVYVDACFPREGDIVFSAGNHHEVVRMPFADYARTVNPVVGEFCLHDREKSVAG
jgi:Ala-tRNA(Pro) deacylase